MAYAIGAVDDILRGLAVDDFERPLHMLSQ